MINQALLKKVMTQSGIRKKDDAVNFALKRYVESESGSKPQRQIRSEKTDDISAEVLERNISPSIRNLMENHSTPYDPRDDGLTDEEILLRELEASNR